MRRYAFTLIEMMVSIMILSIMVIFLYQSYADLNKTSSFFKLKSKDTHSYFEKKKILFFDFTLSLHGSINILNQEKEEDVVFLQSSNSLYGRINPYIAYIKKDGELYRLESLYPFSEYPLQSDHDYIAESLGKVKRFRVYAQTQQTKEESVGAYLLDVAFVDEQDVLYKINPLNED